MRILIVEDDAALASFIRKGLEAEHHAVDVALPAVGSKPPEHRGCSAAATLILRDSFFALRADLTLLPDHFSLKCPPEDFR